MEKSKRSEKEEAAAAAANETKAIHLKTLAEQFYHSSDLKSALKHAKKSLRLCPHLDGTAELLTAFKILRSAAAKSTVDGSLDWYKILQIEPFSHINTIKKQYKKLALTLHPDKNPFDASEEAFKLVGEAFRVLSDKIRRKEYDMKLRIAMQDVAAAEIDVEVVETFWTACSTCRLLHQFERKYLGHNLMCPSCKKSFKAVEFCDDVDDDGGGVRERIRTKKSSRSSSSPPRVRVRNCEVKRKMSSVGELLKREESKRIERSEIGDEIAVSGDASGNLGFSGGGSMNEGLRSKRVRKPRDLDKNDGGSSIAVVVSERLKAKRAKIGDDEMMTLAEMQMLAKKKASEKISKLKENEKEKVKERKETCESTKCGDLVTEKRSSSKNGTSSGASKSGHMEIMTVEDLYDVDKDRPERCSRKGEKGKERKETSELTNGGNLETEKKSSSKNGTSSRASKSGHMEIMTVEDSDFYDFDKDRAERSFRKGQVWAIFDDDDGMPRQYALIDDVVSVNPFEVKLSWLDLQNDVEVLISWEKLGFRICCGRFKVSRKISVNLLNIFSHVVDCDRMAKELYRIYPKKGSVWALYNENAKDSEGRNLGATDRRSYDIAVFLTSYSEVHGLSMGYLEKVDGFKSVFKRKDIGGHAIKWLEKDDIRLFSHQIPARKLSGEEASLRVKDCWELDPASLPPELLAINWDR